MPDVPHRRAHWWTFALVGLALAGFIAIGVVSFLNFNRESQLRAVPYSAGNPDLHDGVSIDARALTVDTSLNEIKYRLVYEPRGSYMTEQGLLAKPVTVDVVTDSGTVTKRFKAGEEMRSQDVTEAMFDGFQSDYPFDTYSTGLTVGTFDEAGESVPMILSLQAEVHGFSFSLEKTTSQPDGYLVVALGVRRSPATRLFAIFVMVIFWALALTALGLMVRVILLGRAIEFPMFTFLAALLFAFPAVRNTLPGTPPLGTRLDFLSFFWAEMLVAFSLIVALGVWVIHRASKDPAEA